LLTGQINNRKVRQYLDINQIRILLPDEAIFLGRLHVGPVDEGVALADPTEEAFVAIGRNLTLRIGKIKI